MYIYLIICYITDLCFDKYLFLTFSIFDYKEDVQLFIVDFIGLIIKS